MRKNISSSSFPSSGKKKAPADNGGPPPADPSRRPLLTSRSMGSGGERTVKSLKLSRPLTISENTSIIEACRRMATRKVDALLLTDSNGLLCGILTDKDIATRVIALEIDLDNTIVSKVMTRNPMFVTSDTLAADALQKMVQGKFRHLPVVAKGQVIALLDIAKCMYDAISRMERAAEKGKAIAAAVEGVEKHWGTSISGPNTFIETIRERMFKPSLSTIIPENPKVVIVAPNDTVLTVTKKMLEHRCSSAVVIVDDKLQGILTSMDILMRVIAQNLDPESTLVEKAMTPKPEFATLDTPIVDALHTMHNGQFLHLPVMDKDGNLAAVVDVLHIIQAVIANAGNNGGVNNEAISSNIQTLWDSAMALEPADEEDARSEGSFKLASEVGTEMGKPLPSTFSFKIEDKKGRMRRFNCETRSLKDLITSILERVGNNNDSNNVPQILYVDEDSDKVLLSSDSDLATAVEHAGSAGWKCLRLHLDYSETPVQSDRSASRNLEDFHTDARIFVYSSIAAGAVIIAGLGLLAYLKRAGV